MDNVFICEPRNLPAHKIYSKIEIINHSTDTYKQHIYDGLMWLFLFPRNWFNEIKKLSKLAISTVTDVKQYIMLLFIVKSWADWLVSDWKLLSAIYGYAITSFAYIYMFKYAEENRIQLHLKLSSIRLWRCECAHHW